MTMQHSELREREIPSRVLLLALLLLLQPNNIIIYTTMHCHL